MVSMQELGKRILERRTDKGLTLQQIADTTLLSNSTISRYETGVFKCPKMPAIEAIAKALDVTAGYLTDHPDIRLSTKQQKDLYEMLNQACSVKGISVPLAVVQSGLKDNFPERLRQGNLSIAKMYDLLKLAKSLGIEAEVESFLKKQPADSGELSEAKKAMYDFIDSLSDDQVRWLLQIAHAAFEK